MISSPGPTAAGSTRLILGELPMPMQWSQCHASTRTQYAFSPPFHALPSQPPCPSIHK